MDNSFSFSFLIDTQEEIIYDMGLYPLCGAMCESLAIPEIINQATGPQDKRAVLDYGTIVKAFIINMLDERSHLLHFADSFGNKDCEVLFGKGVTPDLFTEDRLGDTLDAISELNHRKLTSVLAQRALNLHGVPVHSSHVDTTNISFHGDYNNEKKDNDFAINYGKPKNNRTDLKLATFASAVQQDSLPLFGEGLSGNSSDAVYFREAMDEMTEFCFGDLNNNPILVYDAAASNTETFDKSYENKIPCIIRLSKRFKIAQEYISKAWQKDCWQKVGIIAHHNKNKASNYEIASFEVELGENNWRLLVIYSSKLEEQKKSTASRSLPKKKEELSKAARKLAKKEYETMAKACKAAESFLKDRSGLKKLFDCRVKIEPQIIEKHERPGRPTPDSKKIKKTIYRAIVTIGDVNPDLYQEWLEYSSCFILVSNVPGKRCTDQEILEEYKKQWKIESQYKFIKQPKILKPVWLQLENRIKALLFILWLAVLVAAYLRHRICHSLDLIANPDNDAVINPFDSKSGTPTTKENQQEQKDEEILEKPPLTPKQEPEKNIPLVSLYAETIVNSISGEILTTDGRSVENPTFNVISNLFENIKIKTFWDDGVYVKKFIPGTKMRLLELTVYMGFHPSIYLEPFRPELDLWNYANIKAEPAAST